jgi:hypothetical protein
MPEGYIPLPQPILFFSRRLPDAPGRNELIFVTISGHALALIGVVTDTSGIWVMWTAERR